MDRLERYRGCLLAGAVGDQLGYHVEFIDLEAIRERFGSAGVRTMGQWISDDTQMTLFTAFGMLKGVEKGMPMPACVYQGYLDWLHTQTGHAPASGVFGDEDPLLEVRALRMRRAPGGTCLSALGSGEMGEIDHPINNSKGCGGVMRTAPCGMLLAPGVPADEDAWALQGAMAGAVTHSHLMGYVPAGMLADMVHQILLEDGRSLEQITLDSLARVRRMFTPAICAADGCEAQEGSGGGLGIMLDFCGLIRRAMELAKGDLPDTEAIALLGEGWVGDEALAIAVYCALRHQDSMEDCLSAAVTHSGDSDSTGAIAGNILGAWLGVQGIPAKWLEQLEMRELIDDIARALYEAEAVAAQC